MQGRNWLVAAIAIAVGLIAVIIANAYFSGVAQRAESEADAQKMVQIVVATQPLVLFIFTAANVSPPKKMMSSSHSSLVGMCQSNGASPRGSVTAYQLYSLPYFLPFAGSPLK